MHSLICKGAWAFPLFSSEIHTSIEHLPCSRHHARRSLPRHGIPSYYKPILYIRSRESARPHSRAVRALTLKPKISNPDLLFFLLYFRISFFHCLSKFWAFVIIPSQILLPSEVMCPFLPTGLVHDDLSLS